MSGGRFVWYDLMTTDVEAGKAFYSDVIGWRAQKWEGPTEYTMFHVGERPIGGVVKLPDEMTAGGVPSHWIGYVKVANADTALARATELGGRVLSPVEEIPQVGRFGVIGDPQGAALAVFQPAKPRPAPDLEPGDFSWHELNTTDYESAWRFYVSLFGWQDTESMDMGPDMGAYWMFKHEGAVASTGGMSNMAKAHNLPPHWLYYITVADIDDTVERVKAKGGAVLNGPMEVPGGDRVAQCQDPQGAAFGLHERKQ